MAGGLGWLLVEREGGGKKRKEGTLTFLTIMVVFFVRVF